MKNLLKIMFLMCIALTVKAQSELKVFTDWTSTSGTQYFYYKNKVKTDAGGNVYIAGATLNSSNNYDILVAKYNSSGVQQWIQQYNGAGNGDDMALGLFIGGTGNVYITGTVTTASNVDAITIKFNQYGVIQWVATYNGTGNAFDAGADVIEDGSYNVYITGSSFNASGNTDFITAKYNSGGTQQWVSRYDYASQMNDAGVKISFRNGNLNVSGLAQTNSTTYRASTLTYNTSGTLIGTNFGTSSSSGIDQVNDMVTDASGNIYIAAAIPVAGQGYNYAIIKLSSSLSLLWERTYNGADNLNDVATGLKVDASGNVYATGYSTTSTQGKNIVTVKYNSSGTLQWSSTYNNALNTNDEANAMAIDASGNIYIAGFTDTEADGTDYFTIKYNASGNVVWTIQSDGNAHLNDKATDIAIDNNGDIVVTGQSETAPNEFEYLTIKYVEKYVITPTDYNSESPANSFSYYANKGQLINTNGSQVSDIKYYSTNSSPALYIKDYSHSYVFASIDTSTATNDTLHRIDITYDKVNASAKTYPLEERADYVNYFLSQCPDGITKAHGNQRLITTNLYSNIDLMYSSNQDGIKYYYIVKPSANPSNIHITFTGASSFYLDGSTNELTIYSSIGSITFERPTVYQLDASNNIIPITGWTADWIVNGTSNKYYFNIGAYDNTKPLIIQVDRGHSVQQVTQNENLEWSTFYGGGNFDNFSGIVTDNYGNVYITGNAVSADFPTTYGVLQPNNILGLNRAIIIKFNNTSELIWSTFYGGNNMAEATIGKSIAVDNNGSVFIAGVTNSSDLPFSQSPPVNSYVDNLFAGALDGFILKINSSATQILWATLYGDDELEDLNDIVLDQFNNLYVVGRGASNTPLFTNILQNSFNSSIGQGLILKFNTQGERLWATLYGGSSVDIINSCDVDVNNNLFITGYTNSTDLPLAPNPNNIGAYIQSNNNGNFDGFIGKFNYNDNELVWATYYGGAEYDACFAVATNNTNNVYVAGKTLSSENSSTAFPLIDAGGNSYYDDTYNGGTFDGDAFILEFDNYGVRNWATYIGGTDDEAGNSITKDADDNVYLTGYSFSYNLPLPPQSLVGTYNENYIPSSKDVFLIAFNPNKELIWSTYLGGDGGENGNSLTCFQNTDLYITGNTFSTNLFPLVDYNPSITSDFFQSTLSDFDGFVSRFSLLPISNPVGLEKLDIDLNNEIYVFPNPSNGIINIIIPSNIEGEISIEIYNNLGQSICSIKDKGRNIYNKTIDLSNYLSSLYFVKLVFEGNVYCKKIIRK